MIDLESIRLVQFFLYEEEDVKVSSVTGIFGPNGSGKSSFLDAVQIAMFGANSKLHALNAQADETRTTRSIRSYCLGQYGDTIEDAARAHANTYITLVWRDSDTGAPISMGVCIYASKDRDQHEVRGRYLLHGIELSLGDHLETVNGKKQPKDWAIFRQELLAHTKGSEDEVLFKDAERYIKAFLLMLKGSGGTPSYEAFVKAFRFALRMRFDKTVDEIVRNDVIEARPSNIKKFKEVTDTFRDLKQLVDQVEEKIREGEVIEKAFAAAGKHSRKAATWAALGMEVAREDANRKQEEAETRHAEAQSAYEDAEATLARLTTEQSQAEDQASHFRELRDQHTARADFADLETRIQERERFAQGRLKGIRESLLSFRAVLRKASTAQVFDASLTATLQQSLDVLSGLLERFDGADIAEIKACVQTIAELADQALLAVSRASSELDAELEEAQKARKAADNALARAREGKAPLDASVERLLAELRDNGVEPVIVSDVARITQKDWQPVIEGYLNHGNLQALLVREADERRAFDIYRSMSGRRAVYGAKIVMESRQAVGRRPESGSVAELIEGSDPAAVAYLRNQFGDILRAETNDEAMSGKRTLTRDGMLVGRGTIDRIRPFNEDELRIGRDGSEAHRRAAEKRITECNARITSIEQRRAPVNELAKLLRLMPVPNAAAQGIQAAWDEAMQAKQDAEVSTQRLSGAAAQEYLQLGEKAKEWEAKAKGLAQEVTNAAEAMGVAKNAKEEREEDVRKAKATVQLAAETVSRARAHPEYDVHDASEMWDRVLDQFEDNMVGMAEHCRTKQREAEKQVQSAASSGTTKLGEFCAKYREQLSQDVSGDWRKAEAWIAELLERLRNTELTDYREQMRHAYEVSQQTFRNDVALALNQHIEAMGDALKRLNQVLRTCPEFTNGERFQFKYTVRPHYQALHRFIKDVAAFGPQDDLLGSAGEIPEQFKELLDDKAALGAGRVKSPLDDYREFYEFDIEILRADPLTGQSKVVGKLGNRLGSGSGGEHRAPLYVIAGAALASAYRLDRGHRDGLRLILLDEAFNKMDHTNIMATMRYLQDLGLQIFLASPGENLGVLNAFLHRYYDILRDTDRNLVVIEPHDVSEDMRQMFLADDPDTHPELVEQEVNRGLRLVRGQEG